MNCHITAQTNSRCLCCLFCFQTHGIISELTWNSITDGLRLQAWRSLWTVPQGRKAKGSVVRSYGITGRRHCYQNSVRGGLALFKSEHHFLNLVVILLCKVLLREVNTTSFCVGQGCEWMHWTQLASLQQESSSDGGSTVLGAEVWKWQCHKKGVCVSLCFYVCACLCMYACTLTKQHSRCSVLTQPHMEDSNPSLRRQRRV